jgi:hypothetical protein
VLQELQIDVNSKKLEINECPYQTHKIAQKFAKIKTTHDEKFNEKKFPKYLVK